MRLACYVSHFETHTFSFHSLNTTQHLNAHIQCMNVTLNEFSRDTKGVWKINIRVYGKRRTARRWNNEGVPGHEESFIYWNSSTLPDSSDTSRQLDRLFVLCSNLCRGGCLWGLPDWPLLTSGPLPHSASMALEALRLKCSKKWSICFSIELDGELSIFICTFWNHLIIYWLILIYTYNIYLFM